MKRLPPFGSLQALVQVARSGSLKAAADSLAISSPALTRRIQSLEQFVGAPLFERAHNTIVPNERARALLKEVEPHLDSIAIAIERVTDSPKAMRIRIAVPSLFASQRLMPALPSLRQKHPNLVIDVDTGANRISRLEEGIDAAIAITDEISDQRHYTRMLERGRIVAIGSRSLLRNQSPLLEPQELRDMPVLLHRDMPTAFDAWKNSLGYPELQPPHISYYDAGQLILDAAAEGLGVAFMMESHLQSSSDTRLVRMFAGSAVSPYAYWFACPPSALQRRGVRIFHDWLFDFFGEPEEVARAGLA